MAKKKAKDKTLVQWLIPQLRNISRHWPQKQMAMDAAKVKVHIGFYKNGNPEYKVMIKCCTCEELFDRSEIDIDHEIPVVNMDGFKDWNTYIVQLFCDVSNLRPLCKSCHYIKSTFESEERKKNRLNKLKKS